MPRSSRRSLLEGSLVAETGPVTDPSPSRLQLTMKPECKLISTGAGTHPECGLNPGSSATRTEKPGIGQTHIGRFQPATDNSLKCSLSIPGDCRREKFLERIPRMENIHLKMGQPIRQDTPAPFSQCNLASLSQNAGDSRATQYPMSLALSDQRERIPQRLTQVWRPGSHSHRTTQRRTSSTPRCPPAGVTIAKPT